MPFLRSIGFTPAATNFRPSLNSASASTMAVVVPSPATSLVLLATSFTSLAPMFSKGSTSSISLLTVTPSLVMSGPPKERCSTTWRPEGPIVTFTVRLSFWTPERILRLALSSKRSCLAMVLVPFVVRRVFGGGSAALSRRASVAAREDLALAQDLVFDLVHGDLGAGVLAEDHLVADLDVGLGAGAVLEQAADAHRGHLAALRLLLGGVGQHDAPGGALLGVQHLDHDAVVQRLDGGHASLLSCVRWR